jgi:hypothetical protein
MANIYTVIDISACSLSSGAAVVIAGPVYVGNMKNFDIVAQGTNTVSCTYVIQLAPFNGDTNIFFDQTATSLGTGALVVRNQVLDNNNGWLRIKASATASIAQKAVRFLICGLRET